MNINFQIKHYIQNFESFLDSQNNIVHLGVIARNTGTISRHNSNDKLAVGHNFWKMKIT